MSNVDQDTFDQCQSGAQASSLAGGREGARQPGRAVSAARALGGPVRGPAVPGIDRPVRDGMEVEAELITASAQVQLVHYHFTEPPDSMLRVEGKFRVELCLNSRHRSARACFRDHWNAHRFERIGAAFIVPPGLDLLARSDDDRPLTSIVCHLNRELIVELFDRVPELTNQLLVACLDIREANLRSLLLRLAEEVRQPGFASEMLVELIAEQMAIELRRQGAALTELRVRSGLASWQLRLIDERLKEVQRAPTLAGLAALCRISVRQLTRGFRASRGCPIGAYVTNIQMEHAKSLLASGQSVTAIAHTLGFSSSSSFCVAFRRAMGTAPGQFRESLQLLQEPVVGVNGR
jgi:AraC family transcriptional regulator